MISLFSVLRNKDFFTLWSIGGLQSVARWLELLALGVYVFDLTRSPLMVTLVTLVKFAPLALFGIPFGGLPVKVPPRTLYIVGVLAMIVVNIAGLYLAVQGALTVLQVVIISFAGGVFWVLDFPVRRALIGDSVAQSQLGQAMAVDTIANNGTRMLGPVAGGLLLQFVGLTGALLFAIATYLVCLWLTIRLGIGRSRIANDGGESILSNLMQGIQLVRDNPLLQGLLMVTVVFNLFGFPLLSLVPVLGRDTLQLTPGAVGLLASMEGTGALLGSLFMLRFAAMRHYRKLYTGGLILYLTASGVYAWLGESVSVGVMLVLAGMGSAIFAAMQTTLLILNSPRAYRSRLFGLLSLSIGAGLLGFTFIGVLADLVGVRAAIFTGALLGLLSTVVLCKKWPALLSEQPEQAEQ